MIVFATDQIAPATRPTAGPAADLARRPRGRLHRLLLLTVQIVPRADPEPPDEQVDLEALEAALPVARERAGSSSWPSWQPTSSAIVLDRYAGSAWPGRFVPGLSTTGARPWRWGRLALYALLVTGLTARYTKLLPAGVLAQAPPPEPA